MKPINQPIILPLHPGAEVGNGKTGTGLRRLFELGCQDSHFYKASPERGGKAQTRNTVMRVHVRNILDTPYLKREQHYKVECTDFKRKNAEVNLAV